MSAPDLEWPEPTETRSDPAGMDRALIIYGSERGRLYGIAYRITGTAADAEEIMQETWIRWQRADRNKINNPAAFLTTTTTRLAINVIQSARRRHEAPLDFDRGALDSSHDPASAADQELTIELTLALLTTRLAPGELAAYLLRKAFGYAYSDIAVLLHTSSSTVRQRVHRAQARLQVDQPESVSAESVSAVADRQLVDAFLLAARTGSIAPLEKLLVSFDGRSGVQVGTAVRQAA